MVPQSAYLHYHDAYWQVGLPHRHCRRPSSASQDIYRTYAGSACTLAPHHHPCLSPCCACARRLLLTPQIPANPVGTVYISHGCAHAASNYWPKSADCPECEGLPEELSHVWQALKKGYAGERVGMARTLHPWSLAPCCHPPPAPASVAAAGRRHAPCCHCCCRRCSAGGVLAGPCHGVLELGRRRPGRGRHYQRVPCGQWVGGGVRGVE